MAETSSTPLNIIIPSVAVVIVFLAIIIGGVIAGIMEKRKKEKELERLKRTQQTLNYIYRPEQPYANAYYTADWQRRHQGQYPVRENYFQGYPDQRGEGDYYPMRNGRYPPETGVDANYGYYTTRPRRNYDETLRANSGADPYYYFRNGNPAYTTQDRSPRTNDYPLRGANGTYQTKTQTNQYPSNTIYRTSNNGHANPRPRNGAANGYTNPSYPPHLTPEFNSAYPWPSQNYFYLQQQKDYQDRYVGTRKRRSRSQGSGGKPRRRKYYNYRVRPHSYHDALSTNGPAYHNYA